MIQAPTDTVWSNKRKTISGAFYKSKLVKMCDMIKEECLEYMEKWKQLPQSDLDSFDISQRVSSMTSDVMMAVAFGREVKDVKIPFTMEGKVEHLNIGAFIHRLMDQGAKFMVTPKAFVFAEFWWLRFTPTEREIQKNLDDLKEFQLKAIENKRKRLATEEGKDDVDFLSILL